MVETIIKHYCLFLKTVLGRKHSEETENWLVSVHFLIGQMAPANAAGVSILLCRETTENSHRQGKWLGNFELENKACKKNEPENFCNFYSK